MIFAWCVDQVIGVAPKQTVVQTFRAVGDHGSQSRFQPVITEAKKDQPPTFSQASPARPCYVRLLLSFN